MAMAMDVPPETLVPPIRQGVVDRLTVLLAHDDSPGFAVVARHVAATRAEVAAASAGLVEAGGLDLATLQHTLEVLEGVVRLPGPGDGRPA